MCASGHVLYMPLLKFVFGVNPSLGFRVQSRTLFKMHNEVDVICSALENIEA